MLLDFGVVPYLVFDGDSLPSKAQTNAERRKRREESKAVGLQLLSAGKDSQAYQELQKAATVTPYMAKELIEEIKRMDVKYIVAPYEADAQLVYLEQKGIIDGIISEDSDMLVYGAKRLVTKLNQYAECVEIERADFALCKDIILTGWTDTMFRRMAILSGCDYLPNIEQMGLKTAYRYVRKYKDVEKVVQVLRLENKLSVPADYLERFRDAELTFIHHRVFCPIRQEMVFMEELLRGMKEEEMPYLGKHVAAEVALGVACGELDPKTKQPFVMKKTPRPLLRDYRRQTAPMQTLKPSKSIESFFRRREPLAELDPNSLTPSPSQQRLLENNRNASWEPRLVSSAPQVRASSASSTITRTMRTDSNSFLARASTLSTFQAPKRVRLCSDSQDSPPTKDIKPSPFFAAPEYQSSPSVAKVARNKKTKRGGFDIWSDDSVDDVLLGLPDVQQIASPEKSQASEYALEDADDHNSSIPQSSPAPGQDGTDQINEVESLTAPPSALQPKQHATVEPFEDILESHIKVQRALKTFAYQPSEQRAKALRSLPAAEPADTGHRVFSAQSPEQQRKALAYLPTGGNVSTLCATISDTNSYETRNTTIVLASPSSRSRVTDGGQHNEAHQERKSDRDALAQHQDVVPPTIVGSEDAMVPNSEDEGDESDAGDTAPALLNLRSFAYVG